MNKRYPNGSFNYQEYEDCVLQLSEEYSYETEKDDYQDYVIEFTELQTERSPDESDKQDQGDKNQASCFGTAKIYNIFIIFVCLLNLSN